VRAPISHLYVHVPFCAKICPYCAFYVHQGDAATQLRFASALRRELEQAQKHYDFQLETIYCGGGTPSLLSPALFREITRDLAENPVIEFTLEANPATVTEAKAAAWRDAGVNRISLGAQSFDAAYLKLLGRQHRPGDIESTMDLLRSLGFTNLNIDLMFALPMQPENVWTDTITAALGCRPDHISAYALTYEEDTPFFRKKLAGHFTVDEAREIRMFETTVEKLVAAGLPPYEISNFAKPGFESRHNRAYWLGKDYLGVGPSAVSTIGNQRWKNIADTQAYMERMENGGDLRTEIEEMTPQLRQKERVMFGLRTREGVPADRLSTEQRQRLVAEELAFEIDGSLRLTQRGRLVADNVAEFVS
jgi:oxygen-independent coproporphyrinogen-3 oxidase